MTNGIIKWVEVKIDGVGSKYVSTAGKYLILAAQTAGGVMTLNAENILSAPGDLRYLDMHSAEANYFERLSFFSNSDLDVTELRSGNTFVGDFKKVRIIEYYDDQEITYVKKDFDESTRSRSGIGNK